MAEIMISTQNLTKRYGGLVAVNDVSITVNKGAIVGLVGKNGAGKTTLIRILTGLVKPTFGSFQIMPEQVRTDTSVAAIVERPSIYKDMTGLDNLIAQCKLLNLPVDVEYLSKTLDVVGLSAQNQQKVRNYSLGMKQRLAIAMTLVGKPQLLIMDEPTNGLDPEGIHHIREMFVRLNQEFGITIVISSHILSELSKLATEYYFMDKGSVIKHATAEELEIMNTRRLKLFVDNVQKAVEVLQQFGKAEIASPDSVILYGDAQPMKVIVELSKQEVNVTNIINVGDSLEDYFISLIGGAQ